MLLYAIIHHLLPLFRNPGGEALHHSSQPCNSACPHHSPPPLTHNQHACPQDVPVGRLVRSTVWLESSKPLCTIFPPEVGIHATDDASSVASVQAMPVTHEPFEVENGDICSNCYSHHDDRKVRIIESGLYTPEGLIVLISVLGSPDKGLREVCMTEQNLQCRS